MPLSSLLLQTVGEQAVETEIIAKDKNFDLFLYEIDREGVKDD